MQWLVLAMLNYYESAIARSKKLADKASESADYPAWQRHTKDVESYQREIERIKNKQRDQYEQQGRK